MQPLLDRCAPAQLAQTEPAQQAAGLATQGDCDSVITMPKSPVG